MGISSETSRSLEDILPPWYEQYAEYVHDLGATSSAEMYALAWHAEREYEGVRKHAERLDHKHERMEKEPPRLHLLGLSVPLPRFPSLVPEQKRVYRQSILGRGFDYLIAAFIQGNANHEISKKWSVITNVSPKRAERLNVAELFLQRLAVVGGTASIAHHADSAWGYALAAVPSVFEGVTGVRDLYRIARQDGKARAAWNIPSMVLHAKPIFKKHVEPFLETYVAPQLDAWKGYFTPQEFDPVGQRRAAQVTAMVEEPRRYAAAMAKTALAFMALYGKK